MQRIFKCGNIPNKNLTPDKELNILIYGTPFYVIIYRSYVLSKMVRFFWPTLYKFDPSCFICIIFCRPVSDGGAGDDDDDAAVGSDGVSLTTVLSLLAADGGCVDPDADDVLPIVHNIHQHLRRIRSFHGRFVLLNMCAH